MARSMKQLFDHKAAMLAAMIAAPFGILLPGAAGAGTGVYDMSAMLDDRHPFATAGLPAPRVEPPPAYRPPTPASRQAPVQLAAASSPAARVNTDEKAFLTIGGGYYDINDNKGAAELRLEWKGRKLFWGVKPIVGAMATSDGAVYGYGGIGWDLYFGRRIVATPSFAAGAYHDGNGKDLGSTVEFRSALELAWRFDNDTRLGLMIYHLSNASISDNNPGTEVLSLGLSVPLN